MTFADRSVVVVSGEPTPPAPAALAFRPRLARFAAVGASGVVVNLGSLALLAGPLRVREVVASAVAIEASIAWNYALNSLFTFRDRSAGARAGGWARLLRYNLVSLVGLAVQLGAFVLVRAALLRVLRRDSLGELRLLAQCAGIAVATAWNFAGNVHFTWRQRALAGRAA